MKQISKIRISLLNQLKRDIQDKQLKKIISEFISEEKQEGKKCIS